MSLLIILHYTIIFYSFYLQTISSFLSIRHHEHWQFHPSIPLIMKSLITCAYILPFIDYSSNSPFINLSSLKKIHTFLFHSSLSFCKQSLIPPIHNLISSLSSLSLPHSTFSLSHRSLPFTHPPTFLSLHQQTSKSLAFFFQLITVRGSAVSTFSFLDVANLFTPSCINWPATCNDLFYYYFSYLVSTLWLVRMFFCPLVYLCNALFRLITFIV